MVRQCAWRKTNPAPTNGQHLWLSSFENCIFAKRRKTKFNQSCKSSVWDFPSGKSKVHPTQKPLGLFEYLIESSSDEGDIIFDPCMGSGTTGVACANLGRKFIGIELDQDYFDIARERIKEAHK
jgi:site-specific DNA-methyltransferase (adenine-specific)